MTRSNSDSESLRLLQELQAQRIELEMQNEELRTSRTNLETAAARYTDLYDFAPVGYLTLKPDGVIAKANLAIARLLGAERDHLPGMRLASFVPESDSPILDGFLRQVFATEVKQTCEMTIRSAGPASRIVQVEATKSPDGKECRAVVADITERRHAEQLRHQLNRELRAISACNQALVRATNEATLLGEICRIICETAGYRMAWVGFAGQDESKTVWPAGWAGVEEGYLSKATITWADTARGQGPVGTSIRTGKTCYTQDFQNDTRTGPWHEAAHERGYRSSIALPLLGEDGEAMGALTIYSTEPSPFTAEEIRLLEELAGDLAFGILSLRSREVRRDAEQQLRKLSLAVNQSPTSILITDLKGSIEYANPQFTHLTGYTAAEVIGKNPRILNSGKTPRLTYQELWANLCSGKEWRGEFRNRKKNGELFWENAYIAPIHDDTGKITHYLAIKEDITDRKQKELALLDANRQLTEATARAQELAVQATAANAAKSEFLANMSHEIRTPMNGMIGMTDLLLGTELSVNQQRYAQAMRASGQSLLLLVNDILDFSKIEAGKLELESVDFDLATLLDEFASMMAVRAAEKGLEFLCAAAPDVPLGLRGDPNRLRQVLTNLAGNAVKFTDQGEVSVRVSLGEPAGELVPLRFSVRDTGIGIPADKLGVIFDKFTQVDPSITRKHGGTGLGLAISSQLTEKMGGRIGVQSTPGKGSEFWFTVSLPLAPQHSHPDPILHGFRGVRTLVVDDNPTSRENLCTQLKAWGMRPLEAPNGSAALQLLFQSLAEDKPIRLAILDMQMPGMDGAMLTRAIRSSPQLHGTALVMMTTLGERNSAQWFQDLGITASLAKPLRQKELFNCLAEALSIAIPANHRTQTDPTPGTENKALGRARILVVEDNITNQLVAVGILEKMGYSADVASDGREALEALASIPYGLVFMDIRMPVMGGLEATRIIRDPQSAVLNHAIPIVAMTADAIAGDREKYLNAGMNAYIPKPVAPGVLAEVLDKWLPPL